MKSILRSIVTAFAMVLALATLAARQPSAPVTPDTLLLKDYRPRSIYNIPQTTVEKARYGVIDQHAHVYARTPEEVGEWVKLMDEVGLQKAVVMVNRAGEAFDKAAALFKDYPGRFDIWCGIDYTGYDAPEWAPKAIAELKRCVKVGAVGVGELSDKGPGLSGMGAAVNADGMHLDDARMDPVLEACADLGLPINMHVGEDCWMYEPLDEHNDGLMNGAKWHIDAKPGLLMHDDVVQTLANAAKKHPRTIFIACHYANWCADPGKLGSMFDALPNLYADIGARFTETSPIPRFMNRFITKYQDRILYGTDFTPNRETYRATFRILETEDEHFYLNVMSKYHWPLHGFGLSDAVLKKVYHDNAVAVMKAAAERKKHE